ncbi:hypothetical protein HPP92_022663 [Vanilla planifolia]|uniref:Glycosyl transferase 48 domain-containing protein n=1 Tax=Vanilla planifolia TaxID=51239 RepID=A0A835PNY2_VANPL|nr:hypothetical protein HPP92_022663 [Vanilla planifolia]
MEKASFALSRRKELFSSGQNADDVYAFLTSSFEAIAVDRIFDDIKESIRRKNIQMDFRLSKLSLVITRITALTGILKAQIKRLHSLLTIKESAANIPRNLEARRRVEFFIKLAYLCECQMLNQFQRCCHSDEWRNFLSRIGRPENAADSELFSNQNDLLELRFWASYRGQTLARTVRGMMYYRKALMLQHYLEKLTTEGLEGAQAASNSTGLSETHGFELSPEARAQADIKFTYVVTCQIYGKQREEQKPEAADIARLMQRNEALRIAYIDGVESVKDGKPCTEYFSKLVKADVHGRTSILCAVCLVLSIVYHAVLLFQEIYSIKLPEIRSLEKDNYFEEALKMRNLLEEFHCKPENQNHAIIFTRGNALQTIDMNQDNYFEEALKMRNLLEEFHCNHGLTTINFRRQGACVHWKGVLANPLKVRMHYGHPDVFDRIFHITRGGISKASRIINISEDIYAGFNSTLRQGNVTHHEYIQVKLLAEMVNKFSVEMSTDLGSSFDFFRMLSFYFTTVGFYFVPCLQY